MCGGVVSRGDEVCGVCGLGIGLLLVCMGSW